VSKIIEVKKELSIPNPIVNHIRSTKVKKAVLLREAKCLGHLETVKHMTECGNDSEQILIQLKAVENEISGIRRVIIQERALSLLTDIKKEGSEKEASELADLLMSSLK
jgi:CsoR family transcriptional regulator, copper-sensing transcriptional repressor